MTGQYSPAIESQRQEQFAERVGVLDDYLAALPSGDMALAGAMADDLLQSSRPLANTLVIIPVAAHQEAANVTHTISEYAKQRGCEPFTVILGLNAPWEANGSEAVAATEQAVNNAIVAYPDLDLRYTSDFYGDPVIGEIRRDLWNAALLASKRTGNYLDGSEIIGINHDIDLVKLSATYIRLVQQAYERRDRRHILTSVSPPHGSFSKHAFSPQHPNISSAVLWNDYYYRAMDVAFEAGLIIPMSLYAHHGGFNPEARTHEVGSLTAQSAQVARLLPGTYMETSPRRYVSRMSEHGYDVWSTDSFTATDECREANPHQDISRSRQVEVIRGNLSVYAAKLGTSALLQARRDCLLNAPYDAPLPDSNEMALEYLSKAVRISKVSNRILSTVVGSEKLAEDFSRLFHACIHMSIDIKIV